MVNNNKSRYYMSQLPRNKLSNVLTFSSGSECSPSPPRKLGPADATVYTREDGPTVQLCGDSEVVGKWINGKNSLGQKYQEKWDDSANFAPMVEKEESQPYLFRSTIM